MNEIQTLIDSLAERIQRPVGVDDRRFRAIAYSSHEDEIDSVRRISILGRRAPDEVTRWLEELGLPQARGRVRVAANAALGMVARVCVPVRFHDHLLGFLWLVDMGEPMTDEELDLSERCAAELAQELYRLRQETNDERMLEAAWVTRIVSGEGAADAAPAPLAPDAVYAVLMIAVTVPENGPGPAAVDVRLIEAVDRLRRTVPPRHQLADVCEGRATVALAAGSTVEIDRHAVALLTAAETELADIDGASVVVGVGDPTASIAELAASAAQARRATHLSASMPDLGPVVKWSELGIMRLIGELVGERDPSMLLPPPLRRLLAEPDGESLVLTLEAYLEHAGDVAGAAADLFVHRSSLYNRLHRIEELAGVSIRSGADRLELHLGIRLWRMAEHYSRRA